MRVKINGKWVKKYQCPYCCLWFTESELKNHKCQEQEDYPLMFP